jgi:geranylgeranyl reductase family protein
VGAGPSGLNAAGRLGESGLKVLVLEKKSAIGEHVICTGIVGKDAFKRFSLSKDSILKEIKKIKIVSPFMNYLNYEHPASFAYIVDRKKFDGYLGERAQSKGVKIELNSKVEDISINKNSVEVITKRNGKYKEKYLAQLVIIATGVNYKLHKKLGLGFPNDFLKGIQAELNIKEGDYTHVFIGRDVASGAFAWVVPIREEVVRIGLMTESNPKECFGRLIKKFFPNKAKILKKERIQFKPIAQGLISKTFGERVLTVGEAAGQVKTTTGGGIYYGLLCSEFASQVILKKFTEGNFSAKALSEYEKLWKRALKKEILIGYFARKLCGKLNDNQIENLFRMIQNNGILPLVKNKGDFDWHSELLLAFLRKLSFRLIKIIK